MESATLASPSAEEQEGREKMIRAKKLLLILGIVGIVMFFAGLTSMHIVSKGGAKFWLHITMPSAFITSTVLILLSSVTLIIAKRATSAGNKGLMNGMLILSFALGIGFVISQFQGWGELADKGMHLRGDVLENLKGDYGTDYYITTQNGLIVEYRDGNYYDPADPTGRSMLNEEIKMFRNPSARNLVALTALHALHVAGGILWLAYLVILGLLGRLGPHRLLDVSQGAVYWHFVDILWVLLLFFLFFIH